MNQLSLAQFTHVTDSAFLALETAVLSTSNSDYNILTLMILDSLQQIHPESSIIKNASKKSGQIFYAYNSDWFTKSATDEYVLKKIEDIKFEPQDLDDESKDELRKLGVVLKFDTCLLYSLIPDALPHDFSLIVEEYKTQLAKSGSDQLENVNFLELPPYLAFRKFKRGKYYKSKNYNPNAKKLYLESFVLNVNSVNLQEYSMNYGETFELSSVVDSLLIYDDFATDLSISSKTTNTISDLHMKRLITEQLFSSLAGDKINYYANELMVQDYMKNSQVSYVSMYFLVVNHNKGRGKKRYINFYDVTFDPISGELVYVAKNASKLKPVNDIIENFFYQNKIAKTSRL